LPQFPVTLDPKSRLNFAAFCQASLPAGISRMHADVAPARAVSDRDFSAGKPRRKSGANRDAVSMPAKICGH
jgi:hypothetical protein